MRVPRSTVVQASEPLAELGADVREIVGEPAAPTAPAPRVATLRLSRGEWLPAAPGGGRPLALVVADGVLFRSITVGGFSAGDLLGAGDVVLARAAEAELPGAAQAAVAWHVLQPATVVVVDARLAAWPGGAPGLGLRLLDRQAEHLDRVMARLALMHRRRVDERLVLLLWELAERWGRVTADGVLLPLPLRHHQLAALVVSLRPPVSLALGRLAAQELVERSLRGYVLRGSRDEALAARRALPAG